MATSRDQSGALRLGGVRLEDVARDHGTPTYAYDLDAIAAEARELDAAFDGAPHFIAYAVKANTAGPIVRALAGEGCGADVVSGAELTVARLCGVDPDRVVYSGVAKTDAELDAAIGWGARGIGAIQIESVEEIDRVAARARALGRRARVSVRINPDVEREALATHAHIATGHDEAKFGVPLGDAAGAITRAARTPELELRGAGTHVGSQFTTTDAYVDAARVLFDLVRELRPALADLAFVDTGGGFGVDYGDGCAARPADFVRAARREQRARGLDDLALYVEPGRSLVAAHGVLLATAIQTKRGAGGRRWLMIDAGMNDLIRPALYQARHRIVPLDDPASAPSARYTVVGPVCESADDFGEYELPAEPPARIAVLDAGAYGYTMASRYNGRALPVEVFIRGASIAGATPRAAPDEWARERAACARESE